MPARDDDAALDPDALASRLFGVGRKGFDQDEVRHFLRRVAGAVTALQQERDGLAARVAELEAAPSVAPDLDEDQLMAALGEETARVLATARQAAGEIRTKAEDNVSRLLREATDEAAAARAAAEQAATAARADADEYVTAVRDEADAYATAVRTEADEHATTVRTEADAAAAAVRADADQAAAAARAAADESAAQAVTAAEAAAATIRLQADTAAAEVRSQAEGVLQARTEEAEAAAAEIRAQALKVGQEATRAAAAAVEDGKEQGRELVAEAQRVRERVLRDLARRRKAARQQIEQLRAARERLLEAFDVVRRTTDEATAEMMVALPEARVAALAAGRRAEAEDEETVAAIEAEIEEARAAGLLPVAEPISAEPVTEDPADVEAALGLDLAEPEPSPAEPDVEEPAPAALDDTTEHDVISVEPAPEPAAEEPAAEEPVDEEPVAEEPVAEEPVAEVADEIDRNDETEGDDEPEGDDEVVAIPADVHPPDEVLAPAEPEAAVIDLRPAPIEPPDGPGEAPAGEATEDAATEVDALFARLRESRRDSVLRATAVLAESESEGSAPVADEPSGSGPVGLVTLLERRDGLTEPIENQLSRRVKRVLADEQNEVLDAVRRAKGFPSAADVLPAADAHLAVYAGAVADDLAAAWAAGSGFEDQSSPPVAEAVAALADALAEEITLLVRPRIERCFEEVDGDEDELTALIRSAYREWKTQRVAELCRHHVLVAFGQGQFAALPDGTELQWVIDDSGAPCPDAEDNALAGVVVKGDAFPTGHCTPPAHPGCRCLVIAARH